MLSTEYGSVSAKVLISDKQSDKYITIQEYEDAMSQVYAKHGTNGR